MNSIKNFLENNQHKVRHSSIFNIVNKIATLADQEYALKNSWLAYRFALLNIFGTNIEKCQEIACKNQYYAYYFAKDIPGANIEYCQKECENNEYLKHEFDKKILRKQSA